VAIALADVLRHFGDEYLHSHHLSRAQARAWRAVVSCRTPALGGQLLACPDCGAQRWQWHSCRNRHCPQCQSRQREAWRGARIAELLDVPYAHMVFTLPHSLNALAAARPRWVYETLLHTAAQTLTQFAADPRWLGGIAAFTLVLHSWTQDLRRHLHVHALIACGALGPAHDQQPARWIAPRKAANFLFPVHALSRVFKGKFLAALDAAQDLAAEPAWQALSRCVSTATTGRSPRKDLAASDWVVYAKTPLAGPAAVLDYLSRYTHRTAIGPERLQAINGEQVRIRVRADDHGGKRSVAMAGTEFIERFLQHVLPAGFKRIRHYGLLAAAHKRQRLDQARALLAMPSPDPQVVEDARAFMRRVAALDIATCPHCRTGHWVVVQEVAPLPWRWPVSDDDRAANSQPINCRDPP
jgi:hypothetical protein